MHRFGSKAIRKCYREQFAISSRTPSNILHPEQPSKSSSRTAAWSRVLDEGPGIKEDERELIFQRFWRHDRRRTGNAGLGLSIVQRIADTHAATISVENRPTGGANFSLSFARVG